MRICMIAYAFYESNGRIMQYANALVERGDDVDVFALRREGQAPFEVIDGVNVYRIQTRTVNEKGSLSYLRRILKFALLSGFIVTRRHISTPYDVIHVHSVPDFLVFSAVVPRLLGARVILDIHDILPELYSSKFGVSKKSFLFKSLLLTEKLSIGFSDHVIIANDLWHARLLSRSVKPGKCTVFINYPNARIFIPARTRDAGDKFIVLYPGSLNKHQGLDIAVQAFAQVAGKMPGAEFHIYGEGPEKTGLINLGKELKLGDQLVFHESLPTREIASVMANADLAVVPKRASSEFGNEAASTKIMEFMSVGVPVIVSRTKVDTYYHDSSRVRFFESENIAELADAILTLWRDPALRRELAAGATRYVELNSWDRRKLEYLRLVDNLHRRTVKENAEAPADRPESNNESQSSRIPESHSG